MKKVVFGIAIIVVVLTVAVLTKVNHAVSVKVKDTTSKPEVADYMDMVKVCTNLSASVLYDNNTGVMYYQYHDSYTCCGITPIYNPDGSLKIYEGWENKK